RCLRLTRRQRETESFWKRSSSTPLLGVVWDHVLAAISTRTDKSVLFATPAKRSVRGIALIEGTRRSSAGAPIPRPSAVRGLVLVSGRDPLLAELKSDSS